MLKRIGRWRSWLGMKGEFWYYADPTPVKTADRPHNLTVIIGSVAPVIAVVAVLVSLASLRTNETAMKVGQRAYLSVRLDTVTDVSTFSSKVIQGGMTGYEFFMSAIVTINNVGNTPAYDVRLEPSKLRDLVWQGELQIVPAKGAAEWPINLLANWETGIFWMLFVDCPDCAVPWTGKVVYKDVFGEQQSEPFVIGLKLKTLTNYAYAGVMPKVYNRFPNNHTWLDHPDHTF
jgi:hypothetical protein